MPTPSGFHLIKHKCSRGISSARLMIELCGDSDVLNEKPRLEDLSVAMESAVIAMQFAISVRAKGAYSRLPSQKKTNFFSLCRTEEIQSQFGRALVFPSGTKQWNLRPSEGFEWALTLRYLSVPNPLDRPVELFRDFFDQLEPAYNIIASILETHDDNGHLIVPAPPPHPLPAPAQTLNAGGRSNPVVPDPRARSVDGGAIDTTPGEVVREPTDAHLQPRGVEDPTPFPAQDLPRASAPSVVVVDAAPIHVPTESSDMADLPVFTPGPVTASVLTKRKLEETSLDNQSHSYKRARKVSAASVDDGMAPESATSAVSRACTGSKNAQGVPKLDQLSLNEFLDIAFVPGQAINPHSASSQARDQLVVSARATGDDDTLTPPNGPAEGTEVASLRTTTAFSASIDESALTDADGDAQGAAVSATIPLSALATEMDASPFRFTTMGVKEAMALRGYEEQDIDRSCTISYFGEPRAVDPTFATNVLEPIFWTICRTPPDRDSIHFRRAIRKVFVIGQSVEPHEVFRLFSATRSCFTRLEREYLRHYVRTHDNFTRPTPAASTYSLVAEWATVLAATMPRTRLVKRKATMDEHEGLAKRARSMI